MKNSLIILILFKVSICLNSCKSNEKLFSRYLADYVKNIEIQEIKSLEITDEKVYSILDSAILSLKDCHYTDKRIEYLYVFQITAKEKNGELFYSIHSHLSTRSAFLSYPFKDLSDIFGAFYYRDYLFSVSLSPNDLSLAYPFLSETACLERVKVYNLFDERTYNSFIEFSLSEGEYKVFSNNTCGNEILIE